jgi:hypothetical protein
MTPAEIIRGLDAAGLRWEIIGNPAKPREWIMVRDCDIRGRVQDAAIRKLVKSNPDSSNTDKGDVLFPNEPGG